MSSHEKGPHERPRLFRFGAEENRNRGGIASAKARKNAAASGVVALQSRVTANYQDYSPNELDFLAAVANYRAGTGRKFPTAVEYLRIAEGMGWSRLRAAENVA